MHKVLMSINVKEWQKHKLRVFITIIGLSIGTSTYFSMRTVNQSLLHSLEETINKLAGRATLQITAGESGFPGDLLQLVRDTPGVSAAAGSVQVFCRTELGNQENLLIFGIDPDGELNLPGHKVEDSAQSTDHSLEILRNPDFIAICSPFAKAEHLESGDNLPVLTPLGKKDLTIISVFVNERIDRLNGGRVALMSMRAVQAMFDRGQNIDRIDVMTSSEVSVEAVRQSLKKRLTAGLEVERPQARSQKVEDATLLVRRGFLLISLIGLLIGCFLIFNTMSTAVNHRWKEIGILRALGVERRNILLMFLYDAILMGFIGSCIGVIIGYLLAVQLLKISGGLAPSVSSMTLSMIAAPESPSFNLVFALESMAIGVFISVFSAWVPARKASKLNPILALHNIEKRERESLIRWPPVAIGTLVLISALVLIRYTTPSIGLMFQLIYVVLIFFGFLIMLPKLSYCTAKALRSPIDRVFGCEGALAVDSILFAPRRASIVISALMTGFAFVFSTWAFMQSQKEVVIRSFDHTVISDLVAWSASSMTEDQVARISSIGGVKRVHPLIFSTNPYNGQSVGLYASDLDLWLSRSMKASKVDDTGKVTFVATKGEGILVSDNLASLWGLGVGDLVSLETPTGKLEQPVLGIIEDRTWLSGIIYLDRAIFKQYWHDNRVGWLTIELEPDVDPEIIKSAVEGSASSGQLLFVETAAEARHRTKHLVEVTVDQLFSFFYVQIFIAIFVATVGIINTLVSSIWDRKKEIGTLRALGATRRQIGKMVLLEATIIALIGLLMGVVKGTFDIYFMARTAAAVFGGYSIPFYFPSVLIFVSIPLVIAFAMASAWWPARLAAKTNVSQAIGVE